MSQSRLVVVVEDADRGNQAVSAPFEQVARSLKRSETCTREFIQALREAARGGMNEAEGHTSNGGLRSQGVIAAPGW